MHLRTTSRTSRDGSVVRSIQLAHNYRDLRSGHSIAKVLYAGVRPAPYSS